MAIPVILDTDIGTDIDDTWALTMLTRTPELDLRFVVTETCDTHYRARVAAKFLEVSGRADVTIAPGLRFDPSNEHQLPWVEGYRLADYPGNVAPDGVRAMIDLILAADETVTIIAIGPSPNIARALELEPRIAPRCRLVGMFGSIESGYAPDDPPVAEANVRGDVAAARAIFAAPWNDIVITPLDTCGRVMLEGDRYHAIRDSRDSVLAALMENVRIWAPRVQWLHDYDPELRSSTLFDTVAVYLAYSERWLDVETMRLSVTDDGLTVRDPAGHPVRVAIRWTDRDAYLDHLVARLTGPAAGRQGFADA